jgi:hypothetical protein
MAIGLTRRRIERVTRRILRRLKHEGNLDPRQLEAIAFVVRHSAAHEALEDDVRGLAAFHADEIAANATGDDPDDDDPHEFPLLRWLWEHREVILVFVMKIVGLFGGKV